MVALVFVLAIVVAAIPWSKRAQIEFDEDAEDAAVDALYEARVHGTNTERHAVIQDNNEVKQ